MCPCKDIRDENFKNGSETAVLVASAISIHLNSEIDNEKLNSLGYESSIYSKVPLYSEHSPYFEKALFPIIFW